MSAHAKRTETSYREREGGTRGRERERESEKSERERERRERDQLPIRIRDVYLLQDRKAEGKKGNVKHKSIDDGWANERVCAVTAIAKDCVCVIRVNDGVRIMATRVARACMEFFCMLMDGPNRRDAPKTRTFRARLW